MLVESYYNLTLLPVPKKDEKSKKHFDITSRFNQLDRPENNFTKQTYISNNSKYKNYAVA
jgi:hypothetical protein